MPDRAGGGMEEASVEAGRGVGHGSSPDVLLVPKYVIVRGSKE